MKKLIILVSLIALLAGGMAFGQESFSGQLEYEVATSMEGGANRYFLSDPDPRLNLSVNVDEFTTAWMRIRAKGPGAFEADRAFFTTDFGKFFELPLGWKGTFGLNEYTPANIGNFGWDITNKVILKNGAKNDYFFDNKYWGTQQSFVFSDMVTVSGFFAEDKDRLQNMFIDAVVKLPANLSVEASYLLWEETELDKGVMMFAAAYGTKMDDIGLDFGASFYQPMDTKVENSVYGFNARATFGKAGYLLAGFQGFPKNDDVGDKAQLLHNVRIAGSFNATPILTLDAGVILYTGGEDKNVTTPADDREMLNTLDVSALFKAGKASFRLGYLFVPKGDVSIDPFKTDASKKSLYFISRVDF